MSPDPEIGLEIVREFNIFLACDFAIQLNSFIETFAFQSIKHLFLFS